MTPAINCSPVSTTPAITAEVWAFCKTNSGRRSQPRPPILSLEQPRKGAKAPHTPWDPWGRQNYCKPKWHYLVLTASGASDQDVWGVFLSPAIYFSPVSLTPLNSFSPVSLTPVININSRLSPRIFEKIQNGPNGILGDLGDTDSWKKLRSKISCQTPRPCSGSPVVV